ncbi:MULTISPECIES: hypothetical protein [unclassified Candidatus Tisiphia]|uniref:hypothetical protein n=1 Tax=unclassified Candidatus Tisiphia TaxID=2996318 RepID=UPI0035C8E8DA
MAFETPIEQSYIYHAIKYVQKIEPKIIRHKLNQDLICITDSHAPNIQQIQKLLEEGANPFATNKFGNSAFFAALRSETIDIANLSLILILVYYT